MENKQKILRDSNVDERAYLAEAFEVVESWISSGERDNLNLTHLIKIFG
jgi:hypothetical protein